jgi:hypothetical protein
MKRRTRIILRIAGFLLILAGSCGALARGSFWAEKERSLPLREGE